VKKIFVVGCPRSGTTLVQELLGAHMDVFTCKETHFFHKVRRKGKRKVFDHLVLSQQNVVDAYDFVRSNNALLEEHDPSRIRSLRSAALFFDQMMTSEALARCKSAWVEKSPENRLYIRWIKRYIPSAQFIHVLRDGRDVVASLVDAAEKFPEAWKRYADLEIAVDVYNRSLAESMKYCGIEDHIFVQYEHILDDVEGTNHKLFSFLGLEIENVGTSLAELHHQVVRSDESWKKDYTGEIEDTRLIKFNRIFNDEQKKLICNRVKMEIPKNSTYI
jgi:hypothetical protein